MSTSRCHHGNIIQDSWMECSECWAEHEASEMASHISEQTEILKKMASQKTYESSPESPIIESQKFASLANDRFKIDDIYGAIQLISQAINHNPNFPSFYVQRANYYIVQGSSSSAIADIEKAIIQDSGYYSEIENRISSNNLGHLSSIKNEIILLINELKDNAKQTAKKSFDRIKTEIEKLNKIYPNNEAHFHIAESIKGYKELLNAFSQDTYLTFLAIPDSSKIVLDKIETAYIKRDNLKSEIDSIIKSYSIFIAKNWNYNDDINNSLAKLEKVIKTSKEQIIRGDYPSLLLAKSALDSSNKIYESVTKEINAINNELRKKELKEENEKRERERRNNASHKYSMQGAWIFGLIGSLLGCSSCVAKGDFNLFTGAFLGALLGLIGGVVYGQIKK